MKLRGPRQQARERDAVDPLRHDRSRFAQPLARDGREAVYLC